ncbi:MAG: GTP-binding protein [Rubrivivax sp. SCN 71-131]|jgi:hypothetical protein|nr:MAG: GTP-binding protein [Rubrivivax sp. SCN 71-131]
MADTITITLSLVSHTNVGKTTLARTLLSRDIGEVRDAAHVTEFADAHELLRDGHGHALTLWDTPGFGDSVRLVQRLRREGSPIGWFLSEVWDRWRDRPFWGSQQVVRHVRETSDVVLYLVNAAEPPEAAGYVAPEMELLAWIGKPVLVLLNQLGPPRGSRADDDDLRRWRAQLQRWTLVRDVLPLDAFARCWVQEGALWRAVQAALPPPRQPAMSALRRAWAQQRRQQFDAAMSALAASLAQLAATRVPLADRAGMRDTLRQLGSTLGLSERRPAALEAAERELAARVDAQTRHSTEALIRLHGLDGQAGGLVLERLAEQLQWRRRVGEASAAVLGGLVSGAATGLAADVASGGLTLGGGMIAGGVLGALGAASLARGLNVVRGTDRGFVALAPAAMQELLRAALLRYLAVAHFGRGRGHWRDGEAPPHWVAAAEQALAAQAAELGSLWDGRSPAFDNAGEAERLQAGLQPRLARAAEDALTLLYPDAWGEDARQAST